MRPTAHIAAQHCHEIAETILLPGDPLRAQHIADHYLKDTVCFNRIRNMLGFTGTWQGRRVSVMGTGMGMPSIGLYSYELIHFYGVKRLIRVGSCGALQASLNLRDLILASAASYESHYADQFQLPGTFAPTASFPLLQKAAAAAGKSKLSFTVGPVVSSDVFYKDQKDSDLAWAKMGILAVEMEAAALYMNAARGQVEALTLLTVSDSLVTGESMNSEDREQSFDTMIRLALDLL